MTQALDEARRVLSRVFGYADFKPGQAEILDAVLAGEDVLAVMPTGSGKSLCFQLPALVDGGLTLVVSPLIALMRDQVRAAGARRRAGALNSSNDGEPKTPPCCGSCARAGCRCSMSRPSGWRGRTRKRCCARKAASASLSTRRIACRNGGTTSAPITSRFAKRRRRSATCRWPLTATADADARRHRHAPVRSVSEPRVFLRSFDRPNIHLAFAAKANRRGPDPALCSPRARAARASSIAPRAPRPKRLAEALCRRPAIHALPYHAGLDPTSAQASNQDASSARTGRHRGGDRRLRHGHRQARRALRRPCRPAEVDRGYYQEIGRAGRDGLPAETLTLYGRGRRRAAPPADPRERRPARAAMDGAEKA
jgi:ATP-dependent DNA helicase RecQ